MTKNAVISRVNARVPRVSMAEDTAFEPVGICTHLRENSCLRTQMFRVVWIVKNALLMTMVVMMGGFQEGDFLSMMMVLLWSMDEKSFDKICTAKIEIQPNIDVIYNLYYNYMLIKIVIHYPTVSDVIVG